MSNKTTFKRVALAVVAALGFGVLASGPSSAVIQVGGTMTATPVNTTVKAYAETASVNIAVSVTSLTDGDSISVTAILTSGGASGAASDGFRSPVAADSSNAAALANSGDVFYITTTAGKINTATGRYDIVTPTTAGTYTYTFYAAYLDSGNLGTAPAPVTYTFTVTAANLKPDATKSSAWIQGIGGAISYSDAITADSSISVAETSVAVATILTKQRNVDSLTTVLTPESVLVTVSGVGAIKVNGAGSNLGIALVSYLDTISVVGDGRAGKQTIALTTTSMTTWKTFTVTYTGVASKATMTAPFAVMSANAPDATQTLRVVPKDAGDNLVTSGALSLYVHSSDTKVVANSTTAITCTQATTALGYGTCVIPDALFLDSGTTNITLGTFAAGTTPAATDYATNSVAITVSGSAAKVAIAFDKRSYRPGETAKITVTVTDGAGRAVADQAVTGLFATGGITLTPSGGTFTGLTDTVVTTVAATHGQGKLVYSGTMSNTAGQVVASATGGLGLAIAANQVAVSDTVTIIDPAETAAESALEAAQAATEAAVEAGDAAVLAQEAAELAAQAAADAQSTAQDAVNAVTALSGEVTKLVAQFATLSKLINRIAKKVGVKVK